MMKHATASTFVFHQFPDRWRLGLVEHPRLGRHVVVGGHVECDESQAEAALREAAEESGLQVRLLACPIPALRAGYPHDRVAPPWWITEVTVHADGHHPERHVHIDHQYVAVADSHDPVGEPEHPFGWFAEHELDGLLMFDDTRLLARALFPVIGSIAAAADRGGDIGVGANTDSAALREDNRTLTVGFFGTSIMEHLEAFNTQMTTQGDLPEIGSKVTVEGWHQRGWVQRLSLSLRAAFPHVTFNINNHGEGGATSRDMTGIIEADRATTGTDYDLVLIGCGINDVWRGFQGRMSEAVDLDEYTGHLNTMLGQLGASSRRIIVVSETPFGPMEPPTTVDEMNAELARYNEAARNAASTHGALFLDVWTPFTAAARHLASVNTTDAAISLWSDGVHLTELGDTVLLQQAERMLADHHVIENLLDYRSWNAPPRWSRTAGCSPTAGRPDCDPETASP